MALTTIHKTLDNEIYSGTAYYIHHRHIRTNAIITVNVCMVDEIIPFDSFVRTLTMLNDPHYPIVYAVSDGQIRITDERKKLSGLTLQINIMR